MAPDADTAVSIVVPVYGCAESLDELYARLTETLGGMGVGYEIILVDDASPDGAWPIMRKLADADPEHVGIVRHTRNFGQHAAITTGIARTSGRWVVVMDGDLQDPPEVIPELWDAAHREDSDVVMARQKGKQTSRRRLWLGNLYYRALALIAGVHIDARQGTFSLVSRRVADTVLEFRDVDRNYVFLLSWLGYRTSVVDFERDERRFGESSYTFRTLVRHAVSSLVFQTTVLLHYVIYLGFAFAAIAVALGSFFVIAQVLGSSYPGWTSLAVFTLGTGGLTILCLGVIGLYIGKVFDQVRSRPLAVVDVSQLPADAGEARDDERAMASITN